MPHRPASRASNMYSRMSASAALSLPRPALLPGESESSDIQTGHLNRQALGFWGQFPHCSVPVVTFIAFVLCDSPLCARMRRRAGSLLAVLRA